MKLGKTAQKWNDLIDKKVKYETINEAMATDTGKKIYNILVEEFNQEITKYPEILKTIDSYPCYFGSQKFFEKMVWQIMNTDYKIKGVMI